MRRHLLIANPEAGGGQAEARVKVLLKEPLPAGEKLEVRFTERPRQTIEIAEQNAAEYDTLVAVGGDGTVSEVATGLLASKSSETRLGLLPLGTGNELAHELGIREWDAAVSALLSAKDRPLDACEVICMHEGLERMQLSLVGAGVGFLADVAGRATPMVKRRLGMFGYHYATLGCAFSFRCPEATLQADGKEWRGKIMMVGVLNLEWTAGHSLQVAPGAKYDDGHLNLLMVKEATTMRFLSKVSMLAKGTHLSLPEVEYYPVREVKIETSPSVGVMVDGDVIGQTPARFRVLPAALRIRVA